MQKQNRWKMKEDNELIELLEWLEKITIQNYVMAWMIRGMK